MGALAINEPDFKNFFDTLKTLSQKLFNDYARADVKIGDVEQEKVIKTVLKNNMSFILISSPSFNMIFQCMFSIEDLRKILIDQISIAPEKVNQLLVMDYVNEYCNLMAGSIKSVFQQSFECQMGISIPLISTGFESFYFNMSRSDSKYFYWKLQNGKVDIICSLIFETLRKFDHSVLNNLSIEDRDDEGDIFDF